MTTSPESKWTKGPWKTWKDAYAPINLVGSGEQIVARIWPGNLNVKADAHLIAAAPDLYEALKEVMEWIRHWDPSFVQDGEWTDTAHKVRAALGKAEGR